MNRLIMIVLGLCLTGCGSPVADVSVVRDINSQITKFNSERVPDMGVTPITAQVALVQYADAGEKMDCLDQSGMRVVLLTRQMDGSFVGQIRTPYHQLPNPEGHSWGEALLEIRIGKERLQQSAAPLPSAPAGPSEGAR
jgi:hypothetical protein